MTIQIGDRIPNVELKRLTGDGVESVPTAEYLAGRKIVLFAVPGAFTPTCNDTHFPGFLVQVDKFAEKGVDRVACVSVNDAFVMSAWGKATRAEDHIDMLADGNGELAEAMGLVLDGSGFGMGKRSKRYAALIDDGVLKILNIEPGPSVEISSAETLLSEL